MQQTVLKHINLEYLHLMTEGDQETELVILTMLLDEIPEEFGKMKAFFAENNWADLAGVAHKMKSTLSFIGNPEMTLANATIEQIARTQGETAQIPTFFARMEAIMPSILEEIKICVG